jgi:hypothetical protein
MSIAVSNAIDETVKAILVEISKEKIWAYMISTEIVILSEVEESTPRLQNFWERQ